MKAFASLFLYVNSFVFTFNSILRSKIVPNKTFQSFATQAFMLFNSWVIINNDICCDYNLKSDSASYFQRLFNISLLRHWIFLRFNFSLFFSLPSNIDQSFCHKKLSLKKVVELFPIIFAFSLVFLNVSTSAVSVLVSLLKSLTSIASNWFCFLPWKFPINMKSFKISCEKFLFCSQSSVTLKGTKLWTLSFQPRKKVRNMRNSSVAHNKSSIVVKAHAHLVMMHTTLGHLWQHEFY